MCERECSHRHIRNGVDPQGVLRQDHRPLGNPSPGPTGESNCLCHPANECLHRRDTAIPIPIPIPFPAMSTSTSKPWTDCCHGYRTLRYGRVVLREHECSALPHLSRQVSMPQNVNNVNVKPLTERYYKYVAMRWCWVLGCPRLGFSRVAASARKAPTGRP